MRPGGPSAILCPSSSTITRRQSDMMKSTLCSTMTSVAPSPLSWPITCSMRRIIVGLTPATGSSSRISRGRAIMAAAMARSTRWPYDSQAVGAHGRGRLRILAEADGLEELAGARFRLRFDGAQAPGAEERGEPADAVLLLSGHAQVVEQRQLVVGAHGLEGARETGARDAMGGQIRQLAAVEPPAAAVRGLEAAQAVHDGALARAIGADEPDHRARPYVEVHPIHRGEAEVVLRETANLQQRGHDALTRGRRQF